jgi:hypothetical protein
VGPCYPILFSYSFHAVEALADFDHYNIPSS